MKEKKTELPSTLPASVSAVGDGIASFFQKVPGSAIFLRYVRSSYQNDPVRSAVELFLFLFFVRYLLAPSYSTQRKGKGELSEEVSIFEFFFSFFHGFLEWRRRGRGEREEEEEIGDAGWWMLQSLGVDV